MKKIYSVLCALAIVLSVTAAPKLNKVRSEAPIQKVEMKAAPLLKKATPAAKIANRAPQAKADVPFASATYYTIGGKFYGYDGTQWIDVTYEMPTIEVTVAGNNVTIAGLAYFFKDASISGTLNGNTITFPSGQLVGTDEYGDEFLVGSNDGQTLADIVFEYDPEKGTLAAVTPIIIEGASDTEIQAYCYWSSPVFGLEAPEVPEAVVVPESLETSLYKFDGIDTYFEDTVAKYVKVGFDGDDVYIQGMSDYAEDGWIKGTKASDGIYEFPAAFLGIYESFFGDYTVFSEETSMSYDADNDQFSCAEFITTTDGYLMDEYAEITLSKFTEVAATPADPEFEDFKFAGVTYPSVKFSIPLIGTAGEDLNPEKLSYSFFVQKGNESGPLVFTTDLYEFLEADMTEIPYTFSDDWDIYNGQVYLNQSEEEVRSWDKLGLQSIYRGAGEEHKSNIVWFDVAAYWDQVEGIEDIVLTEKPQKVAVDGQLFIIRDNKMFNALGTRVR